MPEDYAPAIVAELTMALKTMTVASAVIELDTKDSPVFVFRNAGNGQVNIVYRRPTAISAGSTRRRPRSRKPDSNLLTGRQRWGRAAGTGRAKDQDKWI